MSRIVSFEVVGLAGRQEPYSVKLSDDINIFFGLNGSGKTTLLKILYAALRNETSVLTNAPFESATVTFYSHEDHVTRTRTINKRGSEPAFELIDTGDGATQMVQVKDVDELAWRTKPRDNRPYRVNYLPISRLAGGVPNPANLGYYAYSTVAGVRSGINNEEAALNEAFVRDVRALWRRYTNTLLSEVRQVQEKGLAGIMQSLFSSQAAQSGTTIPTDVAYARTNDFLRRQGAKTVGSASSFRRRYEDDSRIRSVVMNINDVERQIEAAEEPRHKLEALVRRFISANKEIVFSDSDIHVLADDVQIPLATLSSGEKQLLRILIETINAGVSPVIIDEPELSMHIDWQHDLLAGLRTINPDCQLIVATHSPEIMAEISDDQIFRL